MSGMHASPLAEHDSVITYTPLPDEPNPDILLPGGVVFHIERIPPDRRSDPMAYAKKMTVIHADRVVAVLVPGRSFDRNGVRHGRGGGWYDRFLNTVPHEWLRVGVLFPHHLSSTALKKEPWDELVDILAIVTENQVHYIHTNHHRL